MIIYGALIVLIIFIVCFWELFIFKYVYLKALPKTMIRLSNVVLLLTVALNITKAKILFLPIFILLAFMCQMVFRVRKDLEQAKKIMDAEI